MPFVKPSDEYIESLIKVFSESPDRCLFYNDHGFIAGFITDEYLLIPDTLVAIEVAWWVDPAQRNKMIGGRLYKQFENRALDNGAQVLLVGRQVKDSTESGRIFIKWV